MVSFNLAMFEMSGDERSKKAGGGAFASLAPPADGFFISGTSDPGYFTNFFFNLQLGRNITHMGC